MKLEEWLKKNNINAREMAKDLHYQSAYLYRVKRGSQVPGKKLCELIEQYTKGEVTEKDLGYKEKEKCKCPVCGRLI